AVAERMPFGRRTRAAAQADVQEDLVQGVGDRVRGLGEQGARAGHRGGHRLGDRDREIPEERGEDRARGAFGHDRGTAFYVSSTVSRQEGTAVAKPRARTFGSKAA